jgi:type VI secretion system protein ImpF
LTLVGAMELSLRERLQPALFDRLIDDERLLTLYEVSVARAELQRLGLTEHELVAILEGQGLQSCAGSESLREDHPTLLLRFTAGAGRIAPSQLKSLKLKPPGAPQGIELQQFCEFATSTVPNAAPETAEQRSVAVRRLRDFVCRDLASLLNCGSLDASVDLSDFPYVQRSVLNYGMPSLAGRMARSVEPHRIAETIETAIANFEPRLSRVRVMPELGEDGSETHVLAFRIEAMLFGQPNPQHLVLRTSIDIDSGDVSIVDPGAR